MINKVNLEALESAKKDIAVNPSHGTAEYGVELNWIAGVKSEIKNLPMKVGGNVIERETFSWEVDEPTELLGDSSAPTPQEYLMSGVASCVMVGFSVNASAMGITINKAKVTLQSTLDLAGFTNIRDDALVQMSPFEIIIDVDAPSATDEQLEEIKNLAIAFSPNAMTIENSVAVRGQVRRI